MHDDCTTGIGFLVTLNNTSNYRTNGLSGYRAKDERTKVSVSVRGSI